MFVVHTHSSELAGDLRETENKFEQMTDYRLKMVSSVLRLKRATASSPIAQLRKLFKVKHIFQANYSTPMSINYDQILT